METLESAEALPDADNGKPEADTHGDTWRIAILSIGSAGASLIPALSHVSSLPPQRLAALLFQAPTILVDGISREIADQMSELLSTTGVQSAVLHRDEPLTPGKPEFEIALVIRDIASVPRAIALVSEIMGIPGVEARKLVCASPAILMAQLSQASVDAIRERFEAIGVEVDVSRPEAARYDLFIGECDTSTFAHATRAVREAGIPVETDQRSGPLMIPDIDWQTSHKAWPSLQRVAAPIRILNQHFERFDLRLEQAPDTPECIQHLMDSTGMPKQVARRLPGLTPITLHQNVGFDDIGPIMAAADQHGAVVSAQLLAFQNYALEVTALERIDDSARIIQSLTDLSPDAVLATLRTLPATFEGPFSNTQVRWLQAELKHLGTTAKVQVL